MAKEDLQHSDRSKFHLAQHDTTRLVF